MKRGKYLLKLNYKKQYVTIKSERLIKLILNYDLSVYLIIKNIIKSGATSVQLM